MPDLCKNGLPSPRPPFMPTAKGFRSIKAERCRKVKLLSPAQCGGHLFTNHFLESFVLFVAAFVGI